MSHRRVIVLALDAASPPLLEQWAHDGTLPNIRALMAHGLTGSVRGLDGFFIGSTWPSFCTGANPGRHGFHYQLQLVPGSYQLRNVVDGEPTRVEPFWKRMGAAGRRVAVLDVPLCKLDRHINGVQIVEWGVHDDLYGFGASRPALERGVRARFGRHLVGGDCDGISADLGDCGKFAELLVKSIEQKTRLTLEILAQERWDFAIQVFSESHCVGHQCWHLHDVRHPAYDPARLPASGDPVRKVYQRLDRAVGELAGSASDALFILMTAHGMTHWYGADFLLKDILIGLGAAVTLTVPPASPRPGSAGISLIERAWHKLPGPVRWMAAQLRDRLGRAPRGPPGRLSDGFDPGATRCFPMRNGIGTSGIRLNVVGREPLGLLQPGRDAEQFMASLSDDLLRLTDDSGRPLVACVRRSAQLYDGAALASLPDLVVEWSREIAVGTTRVGNGRGACVRVHHPRFGTVAGENRYGRTGEHEPSGWFVATHPSLTPGTLDRSVAIVDFAPTICQLLDTRLDDSDGCPIEALTRVLGSPSAPG
jgi:predicted AlkP superfamily phosphohydrolase/phosphomutase